MPGLLINGFKYMRLCNDNDFKKKSLEDNVYFTLGDIFCNAESYDDIMSTCLYSNQLTDGVYFEDRTDKFQYTILIHEKDFVGRLQRWLKKFNVHYFDFIELDEGEEITEEEYMKFDDWWVQFDELRKIIDIQYEKCCRWEKEDIDRDMDRLAELEYEDRCHYGEEIIEGTYPKSN